MQNEVMVIDLKERKVIKDLANYRNDWRFFKRNR